MDDKVLVGQLIQRYLELEDPFPVSLEVLKELEVSLQIILPDDLKFICSVYGGGHFGGIFQNVLVNAASFDNVGDKTRELRSSIALPRRYIVLAEPPESLIVLETQENPTSSSPVLWLAAFDVSRLVSGEVLRDVDLYKSYTDYFTFLIDRELDER